MNTLFLSLILLFAGTPILTVNDQWKLLDNEIYSIEYPGDWEVDESGQYGPLFFLFSPLESDADQFRENVNLVIEDLAGKNVTLDAYAEASTTQLKAAITNMKIIESARKKDSTGEYHRMLYTGDQGEYHLQFEQRFRVKNEKAYVLTFSAEQSKYAAFKEAGGLIMNSFKIK